MRSMVLKTVKDGNKNSDTGLHKNLENPEMILEIVFKSKIF